MHSPTYFLSYPLYALNNALSNALCDALDNTLSNALCDALGSISIPLSCMCCSLSLYIYRSSKIALSNLFTV